MTDDEDMRARFVAAITEIATPVCLLTTSGPAGVFGQTVSAVSVVSADPPSLLACVNTRSPIVAAITEHRVFRVGVLAAGHDHVADTFAGRPWSGKTRYDFTCGDWDMAAEAGPSLAGTVASFVCRLVDRRDSGTHAVFLGEAADVERTDDAVPLLYLKRAYGRVQELPLSVFPDFPDAQPPYERTRT